MSGATPKSSPDAVPQDVWPGMELEGFVLEGEGFPVDLVPQIAEQWIGRQVLAHFLDSPQESGHP